jgi:hypothetical protein
MSGGCKCTAEQHWSAYWVHVLLFTTAADTTSAIRTTTTFNAFCIRSNMWHMACALSVARCCLVLCLLGLIQHLQLAIQHNRKQAAVKTHNVTLCTSMPDDSLVAVLLTTTLAGLRDACQICTPRHTRRTHYHIHCLYCYCLTSATNTATATATAAVATLSLLNHTCMRLHCSQHPLLLLLIQLRLLLLSQLLLLLPLLLPQPL